MRYKTRNTRAHSLRIHVTNPLPRQTTSNLPSFDEILMLAIVQIIYTSWSKEYRGGLRAAERNRTRDEEILPQPAESLDQPVYLVHTVKHQFGDVPSMGRLLGPSLQIHSAAEPIHADCVWIQWNDQRLHVDYHWTADAGMPERNTRRDVLQLERDQWGRVCYNSRISGWNSLAGFNCSDWWYEKWVFNIGLFSEFQPGRFKDSTPSKCFSQMDLLR
jgi:hypothetical protein